MTQFSIKDLADFTGIKQHTLRIWEQRFTFLKPKRSDNLRRLYSTEELNTLLHVSLLNQSGFKVSHIARMLEDGSSPVVFRVSQMQGQLKAINELIIAMAEMDGIAFEGILDRCISQWGIGETISEVIVPFSEKTGLLEKHGSRTYLENILVVEPILKQKLYRGLEEATAPRMDAKTAVLFLPEGNCHQYPLLYLNYVLKSSGIHVINLGNGGAARQVVSICKAKAPDYVFTVLQDKSSLNDTSSLLATIQNELPQARLFSFGLQPNFLAGEAFRHVPSLSDIPSLVGELAPATERAGQLQAQLS